MRRDRAARRRWEAEWRHQTTCDYGAASLHGDYARERYRLADPLVAAVVIHQARINPLVGTGHQNGYERAAELLAKVRVLLRRLGRGAELAAYLEDVRTRHRRKRNVIKLLDAL